MGPRSSVKRAPSLAPVRRSPGSVVSSRGLALLAVAVGCVGLVGLTLGIALDVSRPRSQVASEQVVNLSGESILVDQGSPAATALLAQLAAAVSGIVTLNHAIAVPVGAATPVRRIVLLHACVGAVSKDHCKAAVLEFPPGDQPPTTADGRLLLRGSFRVSSLVDDQSGPGFLVQAAR